MERRTVPSMNSVSEHRLRNRLPETRHLGPWVADFASKAHLPAPVQNALDLSLEECVTNIISYGYTDDLDHWIIVRFQLGAGEAVVEIEDDAREFNPLTHPRVDVSTPLENRNVGGLGIHMISTLMDSLEYRRENGRNILTLRKRTA